MESEFPKRKNTRLKEWDYSRTGAYFVTICTKDRKNNFWETYSPVKAVGADSIRPQYHIILSEHGKIAEKAILSIPEHYPAVNPDRYVIMPDHIHLILFVNGGGRILSAPTTVVGQMKRWISKQIGENIWQKSFHDHIIRNREDYEKHVRYMAENPLRRMYEISTTQKTDL